MNFRFCLFGINCQTNTPPESPSPATIEQPSCQTAAPEEDRDAILAMWQTCVEQANSISQRRDTMNNWFLTLHSALSLALLTLDKGNPVLMCAVGIIISFVWNVMIRNFKHLNSAKFKVIHQLEAKLPAQPMKQEWDIVNQEKKYHRGTFLELAFPLIFILLYAVMIVMNLNINLNCCQ